MFWGITLEGGKKYSQVLQHSFCVTMAALGFENVGKSPVQVVVEINEAQYVLCTLQVGKIFQQPLKLRFSEGQEVSFSLEGDGEVHLTGYVLPNQNENGYDSSDDEICDKDENEEEAIEDYNLNNENLEEEADETLKQLLQRGLGRRQKKQKQQKEEVSNISWQGSYQKDEKTSTSSTPETEQHQTKLKNVSEKEDNVNKSEEREILDTNNNDDNNDDNQKTSEDFEEPNVVNEVQGTEETIEERIDEEEKEAIENQEEVFTAQTPEIVKSPVKRRKGGRTRKNTRQKQNTEIPEDSNPSEIVQAENTENNVETENTEKELVENKKQKVTKRKGKKKTAVPEAEESINELEKDVVIERDDDMNNNTYVMTDLPDDDVPLKTTGKATKKRKQTASTTTEKRKKKKNP